jgi:hypothetical protein
MWQLKKYYFQNLDTEKTLKFLQFEKTICQKKKKNAALE